MFTKVTLCRLTWILSSLFVQFVSPSLSCPLFLFTLSLRSIFSDFTQLIWHTMLVDNSSQFLDHNYKLSQSQSGNRKNHSTDTALLSVADELSKENLNTGIDGHVKGLWQYKPWHVIGVIRCFNLVSQHQHWNSSTVTSKEGTSAFASGM